MENDGKVIERQGTMVFFRAQNSTIFNQYLENTREELGIDFPADYFKNAWTFVAFDNDQMIAGFSIILEGPFRVLPSIPQGAVCEQFLSELSQSSVEVTGFWIKKDYRSFGAVITLLRSLAAGLKEAHNQFGKKFAVYAYDVDQTHLMKIYRRAEPEQVYSGETLIQKGMPESKAESIEYIPMHNLQEKIEAKYARIQKRL
jgi:hypothetical protein